MKVKAKGLVFFSVEGKRGEESFSWSWLLGRQKGEEGKVLSWLRSWSKGRREKVDS